MSRKTYVRSKIIAFIGITALYCLGHALSSFADNGGSYCSIPPFLNQNTVSPNIMIMLDSSGSMNEAPLLGASFNPGQFSKDHYYGYFDPAYMYKYDSVNHYWKIFNTTDTVNYPPTPSYVPIPPNYLLDEGDTSARNNPIASGDFLNWVSMRKIEIAKMLLVGGNPGVVSKMVYSTGGTSVNPRSYPSTTTSTVKRYTEDPCNYPSSYVPDSHGHLYKNYGCTDEGSIASPNFDNSVISASTYTWLVSGYNNVIYPFSGNYTYTLQANGCTYAGATNPCSNFILSAVTTTNTLKIVPTANKNIPSNWAVYPALTQAYADVDETSQDGDSTYIQNTSDTFKPALFSAPVATTTETGDLYSVTIVVTAKMTGSSCGGQTRNIQGVLLMSGGTYTYASSSSANLTTSYAQYNLQISGGTLNPQSSAPWTWNDILSSGTSTAKLLGFGVQNVSTSSTCYPRITQVYLSLVGATPSGGPYDLVVDSGLQSLTGIIDNFTSGTQGSAVARFGFSQYGNGDSGANVLNPVDFANASSIATTVETRRPDGSTPLAESELELVSYFSQTAPKYNASDYTLYTGASTSNWDPYYYLYSKVSTSYGSNQFVKCAKSYNLLITDGLPTADDYSHGSPLSKISGATNDNTGLPAVALWGRVNDMRPGSCSGDSSTWTKPCIPGNQNVYTYTVYLFSSGGSTVLQQAAVNGGFTGDPTVHNKPPCLDPANPGHPTQNELKACFRFDDQNTSGTYNPAPLFGGTGNDPPLGYFEGSDAYELQSQITNAIAAILQKAASGTAVSVLTTSSRGVGSMLQAYFQNSINQGAREVTWTGYTQNLWLDPFENLREDTITDKQLDMSEDLSLKIYYDVFNSATKAALFTTGADGWSDPTVAGTLASCNPTQTKDFSSTNYLWEGGLNLAKTNPDSRTIYTSSNVWKDNGTTPLFTFSNNQFTPANVTSNATMVSALTSTTSSITADQIVRYTIGECLETGVNGAPCASTAVGNIRDRRVNVSGGDTNGNVWKLGDIITSTPKVFANTALNSYDVVYGDSSYHAFVTSNAYTQHPAIAFIGANDGMLHAFDVGYLQTIGMSGNAIARFQNGYTDTGTSSLGTEAWAYIPFNSFPYLRYLMDPNYCHLYFNDLPATLVDASINGPATTAKKYDPNPSLNSWKTILIGGMRYGGACFNGTNSGARLDPPGGTSTNVGFSSFYAIDITDPLNPVMLWEYSDSDLGFATSYPAVIRTGDPKQNGYWYLAFGSGSLRQPHTGQDMGRTRTGYIYILDIRTGQRVQKIALEPSTTNYHIVGDVISVDADLNYDTESIYFGTSYLNSAGTGTIWSGKVASINIPNQDLSTGWTPTVRYLFADNYPITAAPAATLDTAGTVWVYAGSGKYESDVDQADLSQQVFFGFKDFAEPAAAQTSSVSYPLSLANLDNRTSTNIVGSVTGTTQSCMYSGGTSTVQGTWGMQTMVTSINTSVTVTPSAVGWFLNLQTSPGAERVISKPLAIGGLVDFLTFLPTADICSGGGTSNLCSVGYNTGVAPSIVSIASPAVTNYQSSGTVTVNRCVGLGSGAPPKNEAIIIPPIQPEPPPQKPGVASGAGTSNTGSSPEHIKKKVQVSTGAIVELDNNPAISVVSKIVQWLRK